MKYFESTRIFWLTASEQEVTNERTTSLVSCSPRGYASNENNITIKTKGLIKRVSIQKQHIKC